MFRHPSKIVLIAKAGDLKKYFLLLFCLFISPAVSAAVIIPGDQITASYDLSGGSYAGPYDRFIVAFEIGGSNPWELGTSVNVEVFDSLDNSLGDGIFTNPLNDPSSFGFGFFFDAPTTNLTGTLAINSVNSNFDLLLSSLQLVFRLESDIGGTRTDAVLSDIAVSNVPIPAAAWLFSTALIGLVGLSKRRKVA